MKKVLLTAAAVFAFGFANAQEVKFGVKAGLNLANLAISGDGSSPDAKIGFHVGGLVEIKLADKFAIQPELLFSTQGAKREYSESYSEPGYSYTYKEENKLNLTYINIPVMAKYYVIDNLSLEAGPQVSFLVGAKNKFEWSENDGGDVTSASGEIDTKNSTKSIDFGFNFGASYDFTENVFAGLRYSLGLADIDDTISPETVKNNVLSLSFGYKF